jgi:hypothetical protein
MSSRSDNLKDDAQLLLLYVTGEMPASDRLMMEQRLASDAALRSLLAQAQADHENYLQTMAALDAATVPAVPDEAAIQSARRTVRQWTMRRFANPPPAAPGGLYLHRWIYPVAIAASLLIAVIVWSVGHNVPQQIARNLAPPSKEYQDQMNREESELAITALSDDQQQALLDAFEPRGSDDDSTGSPSGLDEADRTIASLQSTGEADNVFFGDDADSTTPRQTQ